VEDQDTEGSVHEIGYDSETQDEAEGDRVNPKFGSGSSNRKKKKNIVKGDSDQEKESDFVEEIVQRHIKNRGGSKDKGKGYQDDRESMHSNDEPLAQQLERKTNLVWGQVNKNAKKVKHDSDADYDEQGSKSEGCDSGLGFSKGMIGNPGSIKDIGILKHKMFLLNREMDQFSKISREEITLGQHIENLSEVIGNVEEVKKIMQKIPVMEAKQRVMDKEISSI